MSKMLRPGGRLPTVCDISMSYLQQRGIKGLLIDIDGTLMQTRDSMPEKPVLDWLKGLKDNGIKLYILSNNKHEHRVAAFSKHVGLPFKHLAGKPATAPFFEAAKVIGLPPEQIGVVGDQTFTDIYGARKSGMFPILVESLDTYLWYFPLRRLLELPFRKEISI